jgi:hypothetical protein
MSKDGQIVIRDDDKTLKRSSASLLSAGFALATT